MPEPEFDPDAALNRIVSAVTPYRALANQAVDVEHLQVATNLGLGAALNALGSPLTEEKATALLMAAVLRLCDVWNADATTTTAPDSLEGLE